jgi:hypothetical protein
MYLYYYVRELQACVTVSCPFIPFAQLKFGFLNPLRIELPCSFTGRQAGRRPTFWSLIVKFLLNHSFCDSRHDQRLVIWRQGQTIPLTFDASIIHFSLFVNTGDPGLVQPELVTERQYPSYPAEHPLSACSHITDVCKDITCAL